MCVYTTRICVRLPVVERSPETTASHCIITVSLWYVYCYSVYMKRSTRREGKREKRKKKREGEREDREREREREVIRLAEQCGTKDEHNQSLNHLTNRSSTHTLVTKSSLGPLEVSQKHNPKYTLVNKTHYKSIMETRV